MKADKGSLSESAKVKVDVRPASEKPAAEAKTETRVVVVTRYEDGSRRFQIGSLAIHERDRAKAHRLAVQIEKHREPGSPVEGIHVSEVSVDVLRRLFEEYAVIP